MYKTLQISILLIKADFVSILRYRTYSVLEYLLKSYGFKFPIDWLGISFFFILFSTIFVGVSFEQEILINDKLWINVIDLNILFFLILFASEFLMSRNSFDPSFF